MCAGKLMLLIIPHGTQEAKNTLMKFFARE
jgi:hypothetical protein